MQTFITFDTRATYVILWIRSSMNVWVCGDHRRRRRHRAVSLCETSASSSDQTITDTIFSKYPELTGDFECVVSIAPMYTCAVDVDSIAVDLSVLSEAQAHTIALVLTRKNRHIAEWNETSRLIYVYTQQQTVSCWFSMSLSGFLFDGTHRSNNNQVLHFLICD